MPVETLDNNSIKRRGYESGTTVSDRRYSYESSLGFNLKEMKGKMVLNIGSGIEDSFSEEAEKNGAIVVSINPDLKDGKPPISASEASSSNENMVAARAQDLPFQNNFFDYVLALYSVPYYLPYDFAEYDKFISEVVRTLKSGGRAYFYPINPDQKSLMKKVLVNFSNTVSPQFLEEEGGGVFRFMLTKK